ncbi:MAG: hypothetical protein Q4G58_08200 [bacterium]|nr:hypothetical protein [bacterium]
MKTLILFLSKYVFGYLLQDIIFIIGIHTFSKERVEKKTFFLMLSVFLPTNVIVRFLPMSYGIHILINIAVVLYVTYKFCEFELYVIIRSTLVIILLVLCNELICLATLLMSFGQPKTDQILHDSVAKAIVFVPFNILFGFLIYLYYRRTTKNLKR